MSGESDYPNVPEDPDGFGGEIVQTLSEWDEPHVAKSAILLKMAQTEYVLAVEDGERPADHYSFEEFIEYAIEAVDDALDSSDGSP